MIAVLVVGALLLSIDYYETRPGGPLNPIRSRVTQVVWTLNNQPFSSSPGFSIHAGWITVVSTNEYCPAGFYVPQTCYSGSVYVVTPGFGLAGTNAPFQWSSGDSGAYAAIIVEIKAPPYGFTGNLTINIS